MGLALCLSNEFPRHNSFYQIEYLYDSSKFHRHHILMDTYTWKILEYWHKLLVLNHLNLSNKDKVFDYIRQYRHKDRRFVQYQECKWNLYNHRHFKIGLEKGNYENSTPCEGAILSDFKPRNEITLSFRKFKLINYNNCFIKI